MGKGDCILAIVEPEVHPHEVCERAAWLARITGCSLELLLCDPDIGSLQPGWLLSATAKEIAEKISTAQEEMISDLAENIRETEISVSTRVLSERPLAEGILARIDEINPRFVVKGAQHHTTAERSIFVHTDWQLIRSCPAPLYLAKPKPVEENPTIVAAVDPTHEHDKLAVLDDIIVSAAQELAKRTDGEVHLLHTYTRLSGIGAEATRTFKPIKLSVEKLDEKAKAEHRQKLDALADKHGVEPDYVHQLPGSTRDIVPMFCRTHGADIVVMGALARWGIKRAVLGSTAERLLDLLPCDVLVVRSDLE